jgi:hypothetical protein
MVEDKSHIGTPRNETNGKRQLACEDANIERKTVSAKLWTFSMNVSLCPRSSGRVCRTRRIPFSFG